MCVCVWVPVVKAGVLSAHDKGTHAEVQVKVRKVFRSGQTGLSLGTVSIYPLSWTKHGCTCPVLNPGKKINFRFHIQKGGVTASLTLTPGMEYLLAGSEDAGTGHLLVTMQSVAVPWTPRLGLLVSEGLRNGCL